MEEALQRPFQGLYMDSSYSDQPKATYSYALNAVSDSLEGDENKLSFEQSNEIDTLLPSNLTILKSLYIGKNSFCLFSVGDHSEIGIADLDRSVYTPVFSDLNSADKLNLKVQFPIEAVYRLRRGCDKTVYFTDDYNTPKYFNLSTPTDFKLNFSTRPADYNDVDKYWSINKFNLLKTYNKIPKYKEIKVQEGGVLKAGSYNFALQYLDNDLNPTEWLNVSDTIIIYHDNASELSYESVRGSTNKKTPYQDFGKTNKSIRIEVSDLDTDYTFYRVGIIEATSGTGEVTGVVYSDTLSIRQTIYNYTGTNAISEGTEAEISLFQNDVKKAKTILQIENRIILGNTQGSGVSLCKLQKYASKIEASFTSREIVLNSITPSNSKNSEIHMFSGVDEENSVGYMPGEIYSFGIVFIFLGGVKTPTFHIPGISSNDTETLMSTNNELENTFYIDNEICSGEVDYWGKNYRGEDLLNEKVRHHRFPSRRELNDNVGVSENFNTSVNSSTTTRTLYILTLQEINIGALANSLETVYYRVTFTVNGEVKIKTGAIDLSNYNPSSTDTNFNITINTGYNDYSLVNIEEIDDEGVVITSGANFSGIDFITDTVQNTVNVPEGFTTSRIMGITFKNIEIPTEEEIGEKITGYYIVQNKRDEINKTILDTGIVFPVVEFENFQGVGFLTPDKNDVANGGDPEATEANFVDGVLNKYALFHPENAFLNKEYVNANIEFQSAHIVGETIIEESTDIQDAQPGTSYNAERHKKGERDTDGYTLQLLVRKSRVLASEMNISDEEQRKTYFSDVKNIKYLNSLHNFTETVGGVVKEVFNLSSDNRFAIVTSEADMPTVDVLAYGGNLIPVPFVKNTGALNTVVLKSDLTDPYSNFRVLPYYKASKNIQDVTDTESTVFSGDSYISPINLTSSIFSDVRIKKRDTKKAQWWVVVLGVVASVAAIIATGGIAAIGLAAVSIAAVSASAIAVGFTISAIASGISVKKMNEVYNNLYEQGLKNVVHDLVTKKYFNPNPIDDSIQWFSDVLEGVYLESSVNMNWRVGSSGEIPDFADAPKNYTVDFHLDRLGDKLTVLDAQNDSGRLYQGFCNAELYELNLDYLRREREKPFFHLPIEYDCCTDCPEDFPGRWVWSQQSFQEELTDNYRAFLPLSYRDIQGESGEITNIYSLQNDIFLQTEDALWNLPKNFQERVTDQIVSFIGTGDFFAIPPRIVVDSINGNNAGNQHQRGVLKTPYGVVFVSENEKGIYLHDGNKLNPLHLQGMSNWFKNNMEINMISLFQNISQLEFPLKDNPYSKYGTGYILGYDNRKHRILITKKDYIITNEVILNASDLYLGFVESQAYYISNLQGEIDALNVGETYLWKIRSYEGDKIYLTRDVYSPFTTPGKEGFGNGDYSIETYILVATPISLNTLDNSWTISYNLKRKQWESFLSYQPNMYLTSGDELYSYITESNYIWKHNIKGKFNSFYGVDRETVIEFVNLNSPESKILNAIKLYTEAKKYDVDTQEFVEVIDKTYNKAVFYNSRQCSGLLTLIPKSNQEDTWYSNESQSAGVGEILIDRNEEDWSINEIRDIRIDYSKPIWNKNKEVLDSLPFTDKVLNTETLDFDKDWSEMESLRDKYLVVRLIFDNFEDVNILLNYSYLNENLSNR